MTQGKRVLFVVPYNAELPESFGIKKLNGDLIDILYEFRMTEGVLGMYAGLTADQLAVLIKERTVLASPDLVMITDLGVEYGNSFLLYSEFMDLVSINALEDKLVSLGLVEREKPSLEETFGIREANPSSVSETYNAI